MFEFKPDLVWRFFLGQEKRQWAVGDLMTKGSKAVCGGVDTEEVSLHIRERCDCALASGSALRGPPAGPLLAAWPGHPDTVSLLSVSPCTHVSVPVQDTERTLLKAY